MRLISSLVLLGFVVGAYAAQPFVRRSDSSATETVGTRGSVKTVVNTAFTFGTLYDNKRNGVVEVLLSKRVESTFHSGREGADSTLEVVAWISGKEKFDTKLWTIKDSSDEGGRWEHFYRTTKYGCCGAENVHRVFDFRTGKYAFSFTTEPVFVDIPGTQIRRSISYLSVRAASDYGYLKSFPRGIGVLTLSTDHSSIDRVIIEADDEELGWSPRLSLVDAKEPKGTTRLSLWHSNGVSKPEAVTAFSVKLTFYEGMEILVPVNGDRFDIQRAVLPKPLSIRAIGQVQVR